MILGLGIDQVTISTVEQFLKNPKYADDIFTEAEKELASQQGNPVDFFAARFAAKQAFKKCLAPFMNDKEFNYKMIEILKKEDGMPAVYVGDELAELLKAAGVEELQVSTTTEGDNATAIALAQ